MAKAVPPAEVRMERAAWVRGAGLSLGHRLRRVRGGLLELGTHFPPEATNFWDGLLSVLSVLIAVAGTVYAYRANRGGEGQDFAAKYFGIGFVVAVRFLVFGIPILVALILYWSYAFGDLETMPTTPLEVTVIAAWSAAIYLRVAKHMRDTAEAQRAAA